MTKPVRLQLSRRKDFDLQAWSRETNGLEAVKVNRSTEFGNPFPISKAKETRAGTTIDVWAVGTWSGPGMWFIRTADEATDVSVKAFSAWIKHNCRASLRARAMRDLRGKNLACWCAADQPCHADVLLEIANTAEGA